MTDGEVYAELGRGVDQVADDVVRWRHHVQHPELSNREVKTAGLIADHLRSLDLDEVHTDIAGHGVVEFVNAYGGLYVMLGVQDTRFT
ncbi:hypothetical protein [Allobranchiibius sp. GilTou38]|uniref:hypothetical protein n=1 Tax=Allobranchiibius sp. GilTou38 TaxID=2815210 RepID=UPI001AA196DB|nr:hypothetical protein [Allobranchiibius sp. GilTou38]MBO1767000.1 hypothetical protein [Allobranchiibius sp. GilTou38]